MFILAGVYTLWGNLSVYALLVEFRPVLCRPWRVVVPVSVIGYHIASALLRRRVSYPLTQLKLTVSRCWMQWIEVAHFCYR